LKQSDVGEYYETAWGNSQIHLIIGVVRNSAKRNVHDFGSTDFSSSATTNSNPPKWVLDPTMGEAEVASSLGYE
jgi:hypothetical protein